MYFAEVPRLTGIVLPHTGVSVQQHPHARHVSRIKQGAANIVVAAVIAGPLDEAAARDALQAIVDRQTSLRTRYGQGAEPTSGVIQDTAAPEVTVLQREHGSVAEHKQELGEWAYRELDLGADCHLAARIVSCPDHAFVCIRIPHFVGDFYSTRILFNDFKSLYENHAAPESGEAAECSYDRYVRWQAACMAEGVWADRIQTWRRIYRNAKEIEVPDIYRGDPAAGIASTKVFRLAQAELDRLKCAARAENCPLEIAITAIVAQAFCAWSGQSEMLFPTRHRGRITREHFATIGLFVMEVSFPVRCEGQSFAEIMKAAFRSWLDTCKDGGLPAFIAANEVRAGAGSRLTVNLIWGRPKAEALPEDASPGKVYEVRFEAPRGGGDSANTGNGLYLIVSGDDQAVEGTLIYRGATVNRAGVDALVRSFDDTIGQAVEAQDSALVIERT